MTWRAYDSLQPGDTFPESPAPFSVTSEVVRDYRAIASGSLVGASPGTTLPTEEEGARLGTTSRTDDAGASAGTSTVPTRDGDFARADADVAPPTLAALYIRPAMNALRNPPGGIHAKQRFDFRRPVRIGDALGTVLTVREKFERKGRRYVVAETVTRNQEGEIVTVGLITFIWGREV
jgi:hypothetical protein